jgi:hypothetical protein
VLTIYDVPDAVESSKADNREGWVEKEKIILSDYKTKVCMVISFRYHATTEVMV